MKLRVANESTIDELVRVAATHFFSRDLSKVKEHLGNFTFEDSSFILAYEHSEPVAVVTIRWQSNYPSFAKQVIPLLQNIEVRHDLHSQGIGDRTLEAIENYVRQFKSKLGICVGLFSAYGPAQRLYAKRGYLPDGRGICEGHRPIEEGETITLHHNHLLWLVKDLDAL